MKRSFALLAFVLVAVLSPTIAPAQTGGGSVTLEASATLVESGQTVTLSGAIEPATAGETVEIRDAAGTTAGTTTTDAGGGFALELKPAGTRAYRATWGDAASDVVIVRVRAIISVRLSDVRLFDEVVVRGEVEPARVGGRVEIELTRAGRVVERRHVTLGAAGGFSATFRVMDPGSFRARAAFAAPDLLRGTAVSGRGVTRLPHLSSGSNGIYVELLERRLVELHYRLAGVNDGTFDFRTADAVVAFHKVQRMDRTFSVDAATWRALADPRLPRARHDWRGLHIEVDQTRQVLYTVEDGEVTNVLHVSTGAGGATHDGSYRVFRKLAGFSGGHLYYPSYFDGLRALHGWTEVPTYAASHGCVRIPYWNATWVFGVADYGTRVVIYH